MKRIDRLTAILILLQTKRVLTAREVAERYGTSLRTVYRDIRALEEAGVPIGAEAGLGYYLADGYRLPPVMFTPDEAGALLIGAKLIEKYADISVNRHFSGAMDKIKAVLRDRDQDYVNRLDDLVAVLKHPAPGREGFPDNLLSDVQALLARNRLIRVAYHSGYKDEATDRVLEPLGLCFYAGHWHLLAFCHLRGDYRDFRVDRIKQVTVLTEHFDRGRHGSLDKLIDHIVVSSEMKTATLLFTREAVRYIQEQKYYFGFVRQSEHAAGVAMEFLVPDYEFLAHWLLSFVDQVTVLAPDRLKELMAGHVRRLAAHYA